MKECYGKKVLIVKVATLTHPANWPGGQRDQGPGVGLHVQEEVYQSILTFRRRVAGYQEWCPWSIQPKIWFVILTHPSVPNKGQNWALQIGLGDGSQLHYQLPGTPILPNSRSPHLAVGGSHIWHQPVCVSYVCSCTWTLCQALLPSWHWVTTSMSSQKKSTSYPFPSGTQHHRHVLVWTSGTPWAGTFCESKLGQRSQDLTDSWYPRHLQAVKWFGHSLHGYN